MKLLDIEFSEKFTSFFLKIYKRIRRFKSLRSEILDYHLKDQKEKRFIYSKKEIAKQYSFKEQQLIETFLFPVERRQDLEKTLFHFLNSSFLDSIPNDKRELKKNLRNFFQKDSLLEWRNIFLGSIKKHDLFKNLKIDIERNGDNFFHVVASVSLKDETSEKIEHLRKKEDRGEFHLRLGFYLRKFKFSGGFGSRQTPYNYYENNIDYFYKQLDLLLNELNFLSISKVFGSITALQRKKEKEKIEIARDLDDLGFNAFSYVSDEGLRFYSNLDSDIPKSHFLQEFPSLDDSQHIHEQSYLLLPKLNVLLYRLNFQSFLLKLKKRMFQLSTQLENSKNNLRKILETSQKFYDEYGIFKKIQFDYNSSSWKYVFEDGAVPRLLESIEYLAIDPKKKINFKKIAISGLDKSFEEAEDLYKVYDSMLKNYQEIKSIQSSNKLAKRSFFASVIAIVIALFFGYIQVKSDNSTAFELPFLEYFGSSTEESSYPLPTPPFPLSEL